MGMGGMGMMNPMMMGGMGMMNSMMSANGKVTKCQPLAHMKLCTTYDQNANKLGINVKVGRTKRRKHRLSEEQSDRYKLNKLKYNFVRNQQKNNPFPQYRD